MTVPAVAAAQASVGYLLVRARLAQRRGLEHVVDDARARIAVLWAEYGPCAPLWSTVPAVRAFIDGHKTKG